MEVVTKAQRKYLIYELFAVWEKGGMLNPHNFGFKPGCTIDHALRIKTNMLEDAKHYRKELAMLNDDLARCFDSIERPWMRLALRRLGVPRVLSDYMIDWMEDNKVEVITGFGCSGSAGEGKGRAGFRTAVACRRATRHRP
jgi:hypothetical protein